MVKSVGPHTIRSMRKVGVLYLPSGCVCVGGVGCLTGPGVCVILAVCQSGLGNGHRVITPALTASSISLYRSCTPSPHTLSFFHPLLQRSWLKKKTIEWQDSTKHNKDSRKATQIILYHCIMSENIKQSHSTENPSS